MLYKIKIVESPYCPFCKNINQTVSHLFISYRFAATFWSHFIEWYHASTKKILSLSKNEIMYGVLSNWSSCSTLNHLIRFGKYFLYCKALNKIQFQLAVDIRVFRFSGISRNFTPIFRALRTS